MPVNTKRILIETESHEIFVFSLNGRSSINELCEACGQNVELQTLDSAVSNYGISALEILKLVDKRKLHYLETASRHLLICRNSLEEMFSREIKLQSEK